MNADRWNVFFGTLAPVPVVLLAIIARVIAVSQLGASAGWADTVMIAAGVIVTVLTLGALSVIEARARVDVDDSGVPFLFASLCALVALGVAAGIYAFASPAFQVFFLLAPTVMVAALIWFAATQDRQFFTAALYPAVALACYVIFAELGARHGLTWLTILVLLQVVFAHIAWSETPKKIGA